MNAKTLEAPRFILLAAAIVCLILGMAFSGCSSNSPSERYPMKNFTDIKWPTTGIVQLLPEPESNYGEIVSNSSSSFVAYIGNYSSQQYESYVDACMEKGFVIDYSKRSENFSADDESGNSLRVTYNSDDSYMHISLSEYSPEESSSSMSSRSYSSQAVTSSSSAADSSNGAAADSSDIPVDGIRPSFKEAMDSYETFFDQYCDFMSRYAAEGEPIGMLAEYTKLLAQGTETLGKLDAMGTEEMSDQELQYYTEAMTRINEKLSNVAMP